MSGNSIHPISEMAMHQQFLSQLAGTDASLFGIDPTLLPNHLAGYHGEDDDDGEPEDGDDHEGGGNGDGDEGDQDGDRDIPTPPFFSGEHPSGSADQANGRARSGTNGANGKVKSPTGSTGPSAAGGMGGSVGGPGTNGVGQRISRLPDPRAQALMQLVPMPSQLPPGVSPTDSNGQPLPLGHPQMTSHNPYASPVDARYGAPGTAGMIPLPVMSMAGTHIGLSNGNPADQVGTWTESVNAYWQPMGLPAFQAPVLVSNGLAATIRDARLAWMVGESVCGHPSCLGRRFERKTNLLKHLLTHVEARPYVCHVAGCDQAFKQKWLLDRHGRVHQANKEVHKCPVEGCTTTCSSLYNLRNHELVHSETKKFLCDFENCGRTFATARNLRLHQRTHTGDKPFACEFPGCGMRYHRPAHLKRHQEVHSANHAIKTPKPRKPRTTERSAAGTSRRGRKGPTAELDNEIDELAGDGESYVTRGVADLEMNSAEGIGGALLSRPRRAAAVAAVQANRSRRWDEDIDFGDDGEEEEDDDDEEDEVNPEADVMMEDDDDDDEEADGSGYRARNGQPTRGRGGRPPGRGRVPVSSSGGPSYGMNGMNGAIAAFSNSRTSYGHGLHSGENSIDPGLQNRMEGSHASPRVAPAAEGNEDGEEEGHGYH